MLTGLLRYRSWIVTGTAFAFGAVVLLALNHPGGSKPVIMQTTVEPVVIPVSSLLGGTVRDVAVRPGQPLVPGQLLLRFEPGDFATQLRELTATRAALEEALHKNEALFSLPPQVRSMIQDSHPDVMRAETDYVRTLQELNGAADGSQAAARQRLEAAAASRVQVRHQVDQLFASGTREQLLKLLADVHSRLAAVEQAASGAEVRAPAAGRVEILDLKPGDHVRPGSPVASLALEGEYTCDIILDDSKLQKVHPGMQLTGTLLSGGRVLSWKVESIARRSIPLLLRESRQRTQELVAQLRLSLPHASSLYPSPDPSLDSIPAGSAVAFQLP